MGGIWGATGGAGGGASTALDNLASVAINTSLLSDTDNTDDLGSTTKAWKDLYIDGHIIGTDATSNPTNLLTNGDFELWTAGTTVAPDGWTKSVGTVAVAREGTIIRKGSYSAKIDVSSVTTPGSITQTISDSNYLKSRTFTIGAWVYADEANKARIEIRDVTAGNSSMSSYHTGGSSWEWLSVTATMGATCVNMYASTRVEYTGNYIAYYDGVMLVEGSSAFAFSDKPLPRGGTITAEVDETKFSHKIPVYIDGTLYYIMLTQT